MIIDVLTECLHSVYGPCAFSFMAIMCLPILHVPLSISKYWSVICSLCIFISVPVLRPLLTSVS